MIVTIFEFASININNNDPIYSAIEQNLNGNDWLQQ